MTSTNPDHDPSRPTEARGLTGLDPVHPGTGARQPASTTQPVFARETAFAKEPGFSREAAAAPEAAAPGAVAPASDFGTPAVLDHRVVAVEAGASASPVAVHAWHDGRVETTLIHPAEAQVWARAGRLTLTCSGGIEHRFTVLAPEEAVGLALGDSWPPHQPEGRARRIVTAAAHDIGDVLTFPAWLARTAHISGERNRVLKDLVHRVRAASPKTMVCYGQTFSHQHLRPELHHPYDHRGLVGHEGYPREL